MTAARSTTEPAPIGVIGGTGLYELLSDATGTKVRTPYGDPADVLMIGTVGDRRVAFLPRHGRDHALAPHRINYRANLWALRSVGVRQIIAPCAVGSLRRDLPPGSFVLPDQVVDRTSGRAGTYFDETVEHVSFADPYCASGRSAALSAARDLAIECVDGGTMVVIEGPRFSTRAESRSFAAAGWSLVNMTGMPEAVLARELGLCYTPLALVTDVDAGVDAGEGVTQEEVYAVFARNVERLRGLVLDTVTRLPLSRECECVHGEKAADRLFAGARHGLRATPQ
ncbi:S-methyl-5'-thioadenosine phosphorylase [Actinoplanes sp. NPDC051494]|uniref:S-methyl-5'-thioadenosine phosphorylase n=1 Tax=Actinoplanes sp. NPDC051494 TaxID=3363907 RepID=UPI0037A17589